MLKTLLTVFDWSCMMRPHMTSPVVQVASMAPSYYREYSHPPPLNQLH